MLFSDQQEAVDQTIKAMESLTLGLIVAPQGSGKSHIIAALALHYVSLGQKVAISTERLILLDQLEERLPSTIPCLSRHKLFHSKEQWDIVLIDEAHCIAPDSGQYRDFIKANKIKIIGLTATPFRLDTGHIVPDVFEKVVYEIKRDPLIKAGRLAPRQYQPVPSDLLLNVSHAAYRDSKKIAEIGKASSKKALIFVLDILKIPEPTLIFACDIQHCDMIKKELDKNGLDSRIIHSRTSMEEIRKNIADFKAGIFPTLINCRMATVGFDAPNIKRLINLAPTQSYTLYEQKIGRGDRIYPQKECCQIWDFTFNKLDFGVKKDFMTICIECGNETDYRKHHCSHCKKILVRESREKKGKLCPNCKKPAKGKFCKECGTPLFKPGLLYNHNNLFEFYQDKNAYYLKLLNTVLRLSPPQFKNIEKWINYRPFEIFYTENNSGKKVVAGLKNWRSQVIRL